MGKKMAKKNGNGKESLQEGITRTPFPGSRKRYVAGKVHHLHVPLREIKLSPTKTEKVKAKGHQASRGDLRIDQTRKKKQGAGEKTDSAHRLKRPPLGPGRFQDLQGEIKGQGGQEGHGQSGA